MVMQSVSSCIKRGRKRIEAMEDNGLCGYRRVLQ